MKHIVIVWLMLCTSVYAMDYQTQIVAETIGAEACNQGLEGLTAVGNVIANRARRLNKTPYEVVTAKNQFFGYTNKRRHQIYMTCKDKADNVAKNLMTLPDLTGGSEFFLLPNEPVRRWHGEFTVKIGAHRFYRPNLK